MSYETNKVYSIPEVAKLLGKDYNQVWQVVKKTLPNLGLQSHSGIRLFNRVDIEVLNRHFLEHSKTHFTSEYEAKRAGGKFNARQIADMVGKSVGEVIRATENGVCKPLATKNAWYYTDRHMVELKTYFNQQDIDNANRPAQILPKVDFDTLNDLAVANRLENNTLGHAIKKTKVDFIPKNNRVVFDKKNKSPKKV